MIHKNRSKKYPVREKFSSKCDTMFESSYSSSIWIVCRFYDQYFFCDWVNMFLIHFIL